MNNDDMTAFLASGVMLWWWKEVALGTSYLTWRIKRTSRQSGRKAGSIN